MEESDRTQSTSRPGYGREAGLGFGHGVHVGFAGGSRLRVGHRDGHGWATHVRTPSGHVHCEASLGHPSHGPEILIEIVHDIWEEILHGHSLGHVIHLASLMGHPMQADREHESSGAEGDAAGLERPLPVPLPRPCSGSERESYQTERLDQPAP